MGKNSLEPNTILALIRARKRKIDVGIVVNSHVYGMNAPDLQALKAEGADIWIDQGHQLYQLIAIDQRVSILDADSAYSENLEVINNSSYTMTHVMEWGAHAGHSLKVSHY